MKNPESTYLPLAFSMLLLFSLGCRDREKGCTDPLADNYIATATVNDGSCYYETTYVDPVWSRELDEQLYESSGLLYWRGRLLSHNDDVDTRLYQVDPATGEVNGGFDLAGVINADWEDLAQDGEYIYVGDFGNNGGDRDDLHVLRVLKSSLLDGNPLMDTIAFSYADRNEGNSGGLHATDYDCEAMIVMDDSIFLFTKQWVSASTSVYAMPALPGEYEPEPRPVTGIEGLVTGAAFREADRTVVLCGYTSVLQPFLYLIYGMEGSDFKGAFRRKLLLPLPLHQVEGICHRDGALFYVSNEASRGGIPQKIHLFDLGDFLPSAGMVP